MEKQALAADLSSYGSNSKISRLQAGAFTLAEVLLTLAIIGVVAALTIPAVVTKVTKDQYVVGLKKAYNTLKAVEREAIQEHGPVENWEWPAGNETQQFERYFLPRFDVLKNCCATDEKGCFAEGLTRINGSPWTTYFETTIITSDGMSWAYYGSGYSGSLNVRGWFTVDVNGLKGPNREGRDIFTFDFFPSNLGIKPSGSYENFVTIDPISTSDVDSGCNPSSSGNYGGNYCATKVLSEGAMNY